MSEFKDKQDKDAEGQKETEKSVPPKIQEIYPDWKPEPTRRSPIAGRRPKDPFANFRFPRIG